MRLRLLVSLLLLWLPLNASAQHWGFDGPTRAESPESTEEMLSDHFGRPHLGPDTPLVRVMVFDHFDQCGAVNWPVVLDLQAQYPDHIQLVFRHAHSEKQNRAHLVEALHRQRLLWPLLQLATPSCAKHWLNDSADTLKANQDLVQVDRQDEALQAIVTEDQKWAAALGQSSSFALVNGRLIEAPDLDGLDLIIANELTDAFFAKASDNSTDANTLTQERSQRTRWSPARAPAEMLPISNQDLLPYGEAPNAKMELVLYLSYGAAGSQHLASQVERLHTLWGDALEIALRPVLHPHLSLDHYQAAQILNSNDPLATHRCLTTKSYEEQMSACEGQSCLEQLSSFQADVDQRLTECGLVPASPLSQDQLESLLGSQPELGAAPGLLLLNGKELATETESVLASLEAEYLGAERLSTVLEPEKIPSVLSQLGDISERIYIDIAQHPIIGKADAPVTLVAFTDYQCPFCRRADETLDDLLELYPQRLRLVISNLPLNMHAEAEPAARAAWAASKQGAFERYHQALFDSQSELGSDTYETIASELKLDVKAWKKAFTSKAATNAINQDLLVAKALELRGTPVFFINGRIISGAQPLENFQSIIDEEIQQLAKLDLGEADTYSIITGGPKPEYFGPIDDPKRAFVPVTSKPSTGPQDAPVTIVQFTDFECPYCKKAAATLDELKRNYGKDLRVVHLNLPLDFHKEAKAAAQAAWAAQQQGEFWRFHDQLFADSLSDARYEEIAKDLGLDLKKFNTDRASQAAADAIASDIAAAKVHNLSGTPSFLINGIKLVGAQPVASFEAVIDAELNEINTLLDEGSLAKSTIYRNRASGLGFKGKSSRRLTTKALPKSGELPKDGKQVALLIDPISPFNFDALKVLLELEKEQSKVLQLALAPAFGLDSPQALKAARLLLSCRSFTQSLNLAQTLSNMVDHSDEELIRAAEQVGMDSKAAAKALDNSKLDSKLKALLQEAKDAGALGGPTWLIEGVSMRQGLERDEILNWFP